MIERLLRLEPGHRTDAVLGYLLEFPFLGYWTFSTPKAGGVELADAIVWHEDVVFIFEAKTRDQGQADERWIKKRLADGIGQINERVELLRSGAVTHLRNPWQGEVIWRPDQVRHYYGVVVLQHTSEPYDPRVLVPDLFQSPKLTIQVFSLFDLAELLRCVSTVIDLVGYYELRERWGSRNALLVHREVDTYLGVVANMGRILLAEGSPSEKINRTKSFQERISRAMLRSRTRSRDLEEVAASWLLDVAVGSVAERFADAQGAGRSIDPLHVRAMSGVTEMSRLRRSVWGQRWLDTSPSAVRGHRSVSTAGHSPRRKRAYLVACSEESEADREAWLYPFAQDAMARHGCMSCLALVANPYGLRDTHWRLRQWMQGKQVDQPIDRALDVTYLWLETKT